MNLLLIAKQSKYSYDRSLFNLTHDQLIQKYSSEHANLQAILQSHERQLEIKNAFTEVFQQQAQSLETPQEEINKHDAVIVLGGDNSFTKIAQVSDILTFVINSDPKTSVGCLTKWKADDKDTAKKIAEQIKNERFNISVWPRLKSTVDNKNFTKAVSEYYIGEAQRKYMSRHILEFGGKSYEQKCSGIIVATGAGSTGWFKSVGGKSTWPKHTRHAEFIITEPYKTDLTCGVIEDELVIHSLNDSHGIISADSWSECNFDRGSSVKIGFGDPLLIGVENV